MVRQLPTAGAGGVLDHFFIYVMAMWREIKNISIHRQQLLYQVVTQQFLRLNFQIALQGTVMLCSNSPIEIPGMTGISYSRD